MCNVCSLSNSNFEYISISHHIKICTNSMETQKSFVVNDCLHTHFVSFFIFKASIYNLGISYNFKDY